MINLIIDILIYNYTPYKSFFFLLNVNDKSLIYVVAVFLLVEFLIVHTYGLTLIFGIIAYFFRRYRKINYHNLVFYYLFNITLILSYYILFSFFTISWLDVLNVVIINSIFILISYKKESLRIKLVG